MKAGRVRGEGANHPGVDLVTGVVSLGAESDRDYSPAPERAEPLQDRPDDEISIHLISVDLLAG